MFTLPLLLAFTVGTTPAPAPCTLANSPTLADQFACYKAAGRRIAFPETHIFASEANGTGCILAIGADRMEVGACNSSFSSAFGRTTVTVTFASIRTVIDNPDSEWISVYLIDNTVRRACWPNCTDDGQNYPNSTNPQVAPTGAGGGAAPAAAPAGARSTRNIPRQPGQGTRP